ncbi:hypothetical protein BaRGS_00011884 [Batillaria attramentaria]|uniref:Uncharacterized protein n=1 Tax=Batillaria attramentaria TaxID=370345 RepID=A0ABD0LBM3_9CAEN
MYIMLAHRAWHRVKTEDKSEAKSMHVAPESMSGHATKLSLVAGLSNCLHQSQQSLEERASSLAPHTGADSCTGTCTR